ncbi:MAG: hypothetical protein EAZ61_10075 [Oscillatoriales cyanobacterium]|nr:MAG: hypothetical protein EAZ61_10075 [Oscillatoriales cyanobacterium]
MPSGSQSLPPRRNWFVGLTVGILRGIGSLLTAIAGRLEANPSDPRPSLGVWGVALGLVAVVAVLAGRSPLTIVSPTPLEIATNPVNPPTGQPISPPSAAAPAIPADFLPLETAVPLDQDLPSPIASTELDTPSEVEAVPSTEDLNQTPSLGDETATESTLEPQVPRLSGDRDVDGEPLPDIPEELTAPLPPSQLEPAPLPLTPEQRLIAALQDRIKMVSEEYAADTIVSTVRIDFERNHLDVELLDRWYDLEEVDQDQLVSDLYDRGQQFDFYQIDILDAAGQLVARPAAIGDGMIVVRRVRI